ncbi:Syntaxin-4 [Strongyloides ratti]|uniref:Syntaxin-4 n=1 Tax=Strongyloides ratti TaxID=34506 RepID=A0A090LCN3_STRRB|nr:Syntaxin-4 [Strongyloides ratti]CEF65878.1 Syntaxin-4 [Strongyloides ratti]
MIKNRLNELHENYLNHGLSISSSDSPKSSKTFIQSNKNNELNKLFTSLETIRNYINRMEEILEIVEKKQSEILLKPGINDCANTILNILNEEFKDLTKVCMDQVKSWNNEIKSNNTASLTTIERIKKNQIISINIKIGKIVSKYNNCQMNYRDKAIKKMTTYYKSLNNIIPENVIENAIISNDIQKLSESIILGKYNKEIILDNISERNKNINNLEKNIRELHEMYCDLMILTELQSDKVNCITKEIEETVEQVEKGKKSIDKSKKNKIRSIKFYIFFYGAGFLIILFIVITIKNFLLH